MNFFILYKDFYGLCQPQLQTLPNTSWSSINKTTMKSALHISALCIYCCLCLNMSFRCWTVFSMHIYPSRLKSNNFLLQSLAHLPRKNYKHHTAPSASDCIVCFYIYLPHQIESSDSKSKDYVLFTLHLQVVPDL